MTDAPSLDELLFEVLTPLGFRVHVTRAYWEVIVTVKHPVMAGRENKVKDTLQTLVRYGKVKMILRCTCFISPNVLGDGSVQLPGSWTVTAF